MELTINYIYLLQEREFIKTNENIYKVGRTAQVNHARFNDYPKGSILLFQIICSNCKDIEKQIILALTTNFKQRKDIGTEYFEGNYNSMIDIIYAIVKNYEKNISENSNIDISNNSNRNINNLGDNYLERLTPKLNLNSSKCIIRPFKNMTKYICVRCGHESSQLNHLRKHLNRAKECIKKYDETDRSILLEMLDNSSEYLKYLDIFRPIINKFNQINITALNISSDSSNNEETNNLGHSNKSIYKTNYNCMYCDRPHNNRQNRWKHEKKCPNKK